MHRRGMMGCAGVVVCFLVLAAGISAENKQDVLNQRSSEWSSYIPHIAKDQYKNYITFKLIKKDWKPNFKQYQNNKGFHNYLGSLEDVRNTFEDPENDYKSHDVPLKDFEELFKGNYGYDSKKESIFIIRFVQSLQDWIKNLTLAMAMKGLVTDYNIFIFELHDFRATINYGFVQTTVGIDGGIFLALGNILGEYFDSVIEQKLIKPNQIHLFGFCWAGITSGYIAQHISAKHKEKIKSLLGMSSINHNILLADDAEVVQVYHVNSIYFGSFIRKANIDIVFNNGMLQPGCHVLDIQCNHERGVKILWFVILYPDLFVARKCKSWSDFYYCRCDGEDTMAITYPPKRPEPTKGGIFFVKTTSGMPYGLGAEGAVGPKCLQS